MNEPHANRNDDLILRLSAVARGLEDEGQLNLAKLFRAAAAGEIYRETQDRPRQGDGLEEAMRRAVADLSSRSTTSEPLKAAMAYAVEAFERDEMPLLTDVPNPFVCWFCGEVMVGKPPDQCPTCQARRYTFQEISPTFYILHPPMERSEVEAVLEANLADVERSVAGVDEAAADRGVWPMREMMAHLQGAQDLMFGRARRMLAEENPNLGSVPPTEVGADDGDESTSMADKLTSFGATRRELLEWFRSLAEEELPRTGMHPEWGQLTILSQVTYMARHEQMHLAELQARREGR